MEVFFCKRFLSIGPDLMWMKSQRWKVKWLVVKPNQRHFNVHKNSRAPAAAVATSTFLCQAIRQLFSVRSGQNCQSVSFTQFFSRLEAVPCIVCWPGTLGVRRRASFSMKLSPLGWLTLLLRKSCPSSSKSPSSFSLTPPLVTRLSSGND